MKMKKFVRFIDAVLIVVGIIIILLIPTCSEAQIEGNIRTSFIYNSEITYNNNKTSVLHRNWVDLTHDYHQNLMFEADVYVPFSSFDSDSPMRSDKLFFYGRGGFILDHLTFRNSLWTFNLEYQPSKEQPIFIKAEIDATQITNHKYPTYKEPRIDGEEVYLSVHYNNQKHRRQYPNLVNFYVQLDYLFHSKYRTISPQIRELNQNNSNALRTIIGIVGNIGDVVFIEQGITTLTEQFLFEKVTFSPYNSYYTTKAWVKVNKFDVAFEHICHHPLYSGNDNPLISGVTNRVYLNFGF
jgi:hypothetical protein